MTIALRGTGQFGTALNGGNVTLTFDVAPEPGDVVIVSGGWPRSGGGVGISTAGYTEIAAISNIGGSFAAFYKVMGASPDSNVVCLGNAQAEDGICYGSYVLSGVHADVQDQTPESASQEQPPAIVTQTDNAWVIICSGSWTTDDVFTAPAGYGNFIFDFANDTRDYVAAMATKEVSPAGTETPATWGAWDTGYPLSITIALKPAAAGLNMNVKADGGWKAVNSGMVKVNGAWKSISSLMVKAPADWKQV